MTSASQTNTAYAQYPVGFVHFLSQCGNTAFWASLIIVFGILKVPLANTKAVKPVNQLITYFFQQFARFSIGLFNRFNDIDWHINVDGELSQDQWYLLISNHQSWADIMILTDFSRHKIPCPKFFLKQQLLYVPFVGLSAWAMDMPFMQRYSRQYLEKHPEKKGQDIETTRKACEKYKSTPTTIINFVEGTRCTEAKRKDISHYDNLLPPRAGGIAFTSEAIPAVTKHILDVSIVYPDTQHVMQDLVFGRVKSIVIDVRVLSLPDNCKGNSFSDPETRDKFQTWLNAHWKNKDQRISVLKNNHKP